MKTNKEVISKITISFEYTHAQITCPSHLKKQKTNKNSLDVSETREASGPHVLLPQYFGAFKEQAAGFCVKQEKKPIMIILKNKLKQNPMQST